LTQLLANENVAGNVVIALRADGHDVVWIKEVGPGSTDDVVLSLALAENRVLLTFDNDFGELAFRRDVACLQCKCRTVMA
jgi:predicted nuclease of predicted toxin-antitoxin system